MKNLKNLIDLDKYKYAKSILSIAGSLGADENLEIYVEICMCDGKVLKSWNTIDNDKILKSWNKNE